MLETAKTTVETAINAVNAAGQDKRYMAVIAKLNEALALLESIEE